jgi:two-component system, NtrC family, sensor kinase
VKEKTDIGGMPVPGFPAAYYASLLTGLVHKANNVITVLTGHSGLLLLEPNLSTKVHEPVKRISRAAEMLSRYMDEASAISKVTPLVLEPINVLEFGKALTRPPGLKVQVLCDRDLKILGDRRKLKVIFEQILQNAMEANASSEIVTVTREEAIIGLSFRDNGHGINKEVLPRIFDPFFTTRIQEGQFGLGLFRARGELARMNGEISGASDGQTYAEILVRMPAA